MFIYFATGTSIAGQAQQFRHSRYQPFTMFGKELDTVAARYTGNKDKNTYRILIIGGSTAAIFKPTILENEFRTRYPGWEFEVINLGYGGYNARQEVVVVGIWGLQLDPDLLISVTGGNDLIHRIRISRAGTFYLDGSYRFTITRPFLAPFTELLRYSQFSNGLRRELARIRVKDVSKYEDAIPVLVRAQHSVNMLAKGACVDRMIVLQPLNAFKEPLSDQEAAFTRYKYREHVVMALYDLAHAGLEALAKRDDVMYLDGRNIYDGMEQTIFIDDAHFKGDEGYQILARKMASRTKGKILWDWPACWSHRAMRPDR